MMIRHLKFVSLLLSALIAYMPIKAEKADTITVFTIGDSTMADKSLDNENQERGWGQMLPGFLTGKIRVDNRAKDGRSSKSFIDEGLWTDVLKKLKRGDYVFIQFGHNDEKTAAGLHTVPGGTFDDNLRRFVRDARAKGAHPVLFNSIVRRNFPPSANVPHQGSYEFEGRVLVDTHGAYLDAPRHVASELKVPFVDMNKLTHDLVTEMGVERSKTLYMWIPKGQYSFAPDGRIDNTHFNVYGATVMAGIAAREVGKAVPALRPFIKKQPTEIYTAKYKDDKRCAISYTFDDGLKEQYTMLYPQLEKYGFKATFCIIGSITDNPENDKEKPRMTWEELRELANHGHEISNHSWSHPDFRRLSHEQIRREIDRTDSLIELKIGRRPLTFFYPGNNRNDSVVKWASEGKVGTRTYEKAIGGQTYHTTVSELDKWVRSLKETGGWGVPMGHGITYAYAYFYDPNVLWTHFRHVKEQERDVWVDTFEHVAAYKKEQEATRLNIRKRRNGYDVVPSLPLDKRLFSSLLTLVIKNPKGKVTASQDGIQLQAKRTGDGYIVDFNPHGGEVSIIEK